MSRLLGRRNWIDQSSCSAKRRVSAGGSAVMSPPSKLRSTCWLQAGQEASASMPSPKRWRLSSSSRYSSRPIGRPAIDSTSAPSTAGTTSASVRQRAGERLADSQQLMRRLAAVIEHPLGRRHGERRISRLLLFEPDPALVFELDVLDGDDVGVGIQVRHCLELGDPAAIHVVDDCKQPRLVVDLDRQVLAEVLERDLGAEALAEVPDLVRPLLEIDVVSDPSFEGDGVVLGAAG